MGRLTSMLSWCTRVSRPMVYASRPGTTVSCCWAVRRPYKNTTQNRFTVGNAKAA